jgi:putative membrane protein
MAERVLVLAVDIDNDLYTKTKITGPVIGRTDNLKAAAKLALADPLDTDSNAMFEAVKRYDELKAKGYSVAIATITGAEKEGYVADSELARQTELILNKFKADACLLVTDGASDNRVIPILKSRIKVNSVDVVRMKQAEQFETTYFTLLEKLKEPHYARIVFGIPAVLLLLFAISYYLNFGWQLPVALIGVYLILKGFGLEEGLVESFRGFGFSIDRLSFVFYLGSILFFVISLVVASGDYAVAVAAKSGSLAIVSYTLEGFILLLPICLLLYLVGRVIDLNRKRMRYMAIAQGTYVGYSITSLVMLYLVAAWFIGQIYFWQLLLYGGVAILAGYAVAAFSSVLRKRAMKLSRMKDKGVINEIGAYIGRISEVDQKRGFIFVKTEYGNTIRYDIDRVASVSDRVIIR